MRRVLVLPMLVTLGCTSDVADSSRVTATQSPAAMAAAPVTAGPSYKGKWSVSVSVPQSAWPVPLGPGQQYFTFTMDCVLQQDGLGVCGSGKGALRFTTVPTHGELRLMLDVPEGTFNSLGYFFTAKLSPMGTGGALGGVTSVELWGDPFRAGPHQGGLSMTPR